jgi:non-ribosomal peptide synthase protein (TIGR01720 family)
MMPDELSAQIAELSPEKKRLLEMLFQQGENREDRAEYTAPRNATEKRLAEIWESVLGAERVGIEDNFFELGGDSIQGIQIVAKARSAGIPIQTQTLFAHPTIAELAKRVAPLTAAGAEQGILEGPVALTPVQSWFWEQELPEPDHWNEAVLMECAPEVSLEILRAAAEAIIRHHDALRLRFVRDGAVIRQEYGPPPEHTPIEVIRIEGVDEIETHANRLHAGLSLAEGRILRLAWFDLGPHRRARLLIVAHHLAVDAVSYRIFMDDLSQACRDLVAGREISLPAKTDSFRAWADSLSRTATDAERSYWLEQQSGAAGVIPCDGRSANLEADARELRREWDEGETSLLRRWRSGAIETMLIAALAQVLREWSESDIVRFDLEGHGREGHRREGMEPALDVSRTIGWFTALSPARILLPPGTGVTGAFGAVEQHFAGRPRKGLGYGILRYLGEDRLPAPDRRALAVFNYLGQFDEPDPDAMFTPLDENLGTASAPANPRPYSIQLVCSIAGRRLRMRWIYGSGLHREDTIARWALRLEECLRELMGSAAVRRDSASVALQADEMQSLLEKYGD